MTCTTRTLTALLLSAFALGSSPRAGAAEPQTTARPATRSLYDRVGGEKAIRAVVDDFVPAAAADPKVDFTRGGKWQASDAFVATLKDHLAAMLGSAFGGPQKYTGRTMKVAHQGMGITTAQFEAIAGHLKAALEKHKVPKAEIAEIMAIAASTAPDIIEKK
jgi:hemoglobin